MNAMLSALVEAEESARGMAGRVELLTSTVTLKAWVVQTVENGNRRQDALPIDLPDFIETAEDAAQWCCSPVRHKAAIIVLRVDAGQRPERRNLLSTFVVKKRTRDLWVRGEGGKTVRAPAEYAERVMQVHVHDGFDPVEPFRVTAETTQAEIAGHDVTLVEQS